MLGISSCIAKAHIGPKSVIAVRCEGIDGQLRRNSTRLLSRANEKKTCPFARKEPPRPSRPNGQFLLDNSLQIEY
jgi:hypothetical protein